ncbi:sigma-70 family RNA polymerase sigma factor [Prolixibacteraceae bacterium JC049]|nr:sigma-70 family RNA polymerase sigma factor [Prolixibacteraceae bacterium JC049]
MQAEEQKILNEIRGRNLRAFESFFHSYYNSCVTFANHFLHSVDESEDLVQEWFIYFWENSRWLIINTSLKAYLFKSIKNRCLNRLKALDIKDRYEILYFEALSQLPLAKEDYDCVEVIKQILMEMPEQMRTVMERKYWHEQSISQIAEDLNISEGTVKTQLFRGRVRIKELLPHVAQTTFITIFFDAL